MRLNINFTGHTDRLAAVIAVSGYVLTAVLIVVMFFVVFGAREIKKRIPESEKKLAALKQQGTGGAFSFKTPAPEEIEALAGRAAVLNRMQIGGGAGVSKILHKIERMLPGRTAIESFRYGLKNNEIELQAESENIEELAGFLAALEKDDFFSDVKLRNQMWKEEKGGAKAVFTVSMKERK
ncbi:MAG: PilN domain-containing protein [Candidatus Goldiibacteriota bacterium]